MSNYIAEIQKLEKTIQDNKTEATKLEERLKVLKEERANLINDLKKQKIEEKDLEEKIKTLDEELNKKIEEIENELK